MSENSHPAPGSGILSNVYSFMSREVSTFFNSATGGDSKPKRRSHKQADSRVKSSKSTHTGPIRNTRPERTSGTEDIGRQNTQERSTRPPDRSPKPSSSRIRQPVKSPARTTLDPQLTYAHYTEELAELSGPDSPQSPKHVAATRDLRRQRSSISMPCSLDPRSPSPDSNNSDEDGGQHVHFALEPSSRRPTRKSASVTSFNQEEEVSRSASSTSSFRPRPSVQSVVRTFSSDGDPSLLLPKTSPSRKGKEKAWDDRNRSSLSLHEDVSPYLDTGKGRASSSNLSLDRMGADTSRETRVRGKERELLAAREEQNRNERRWQRDPSVTVDHDPARDREREGDKQKIKSLEDEITRLRQELSRRPLGYPPPPPPPPPPPSSSWRRPATADSDLNLASARAGLKHAPPPAEAPINPGPVHRKGQPSVGVSADQMVAFLNEMKTVRLRKVSRDSSATRDIPALSTSQQAERSFSFGRREPQASGSLSNRISSLYSSSRASASTSTLGAGSAGPLARAGEKRKRFESSMVDARDSERASKQRRSFGSAESSLVGSSSIADIPPSSHISRSTEDPTPSLCSDNDRENDFSQDDLPPSTPPTSLSNHPSYNSVEPPARTAERDILDDVDMEDEHRTGSPPAKRMDTPYRPRVVSDAFSKRLPISPLPAPSPRKPRPPARTSSSRTSINFNDPPRRVLVQPAEPEESDDDDDPLSMRFPSMEQHPPDDRPLSFPPSRIPPSATQRKKKKANNPSPRSNHSRNESSQTASSSRTHRRKTLDEELRSATVGQEAADADLDSGTLIGVGTRSKRRGFLARGGAGGPPVLMGVGYVEGAREGDTSEEDAGAVDGDNDSEYQPRSKPKGRGKKRGS